MSDVSGIPNMGFGGGGFFGGSAALGQPAMSSAQINASMGWPGPQAQNQALLNSIFSNFGRQTDYYSGLSAAFGRQTGGFRPGMPATPTPPVTRGPNLPSPYSPSPFAGGYNPYTQAAEARAALARAMQTGAGAMGRFGTPNINLGYNPGMANTFAPQGGFNSNPFQNRFGFGFPNAGTPSQYAPGAQMPPSFSQPYGADNPGGALPLGGGPGIYQNSPFGMDPNPGS